MKLRFLPFTFGLFFLFGTSFVNAQSYKINDVKYNIQGSTREYSLKTKVKVDDKRIFEDEDSLVSYIEDFKKQIENTRNFDSVDVDFTVSEENEEGISEVNLVVDVVDSLHFIGIPYPKYKSGDSLKLMIKAKDTNFLGSMETLSADISYEMEFDDKDDTVIEDHKFGLSFDFEIPFRVNPFDVAWSNALDFSYTLGNSTPEWNAKTGFEFTLPFDNFSIVWGVYQSFVRDLDYEDKEFNTKTVHYGDGTYFIEEVDFSVPIVIQKIENWGNIYYTPFANATYNWDFDGIHPDNEDLIGPSMTFGQKLSTERVNWIENFRNGLSATLTQSFGYNFESYAFNPGISGELKAYKAFERFGLCTDLYAYAYMNGDENFGSRMRGIRDDLYFNDDDYEDEKECTAATAIVMNFDLPIKLFTLRFEKLPGLSKLSKLDMEIQASPFVDIALSKNKAAGTTFNIKDSFVCAGLEGIAYPLKFKGFQIRGSLGIDLVQKTPKVKNKFNQDWRNGKWWELSIGIGLHY